MNFSVVPLLLHNPDVPAGARMALREALGVPPAERVPLLRRAARILHREASLDCVDALELVDIPDDYVLR
ncbi:MAG TPA: hypothetical protein VL400_13460 [Polyangiaceae bacterium]|jgi:hypothetical protein|nr:hypothetical protein [Polyangiaceae bacterium]